MKKCTAHLQRADTCSDLKKNNEILWAIGIENLSNFDRIYYRMFYFLVETYLRRMHYLLDKWGNRNLLSNLKTDFAKTAAVNLVANEQQKHSLRFKKT